MKKIFNIMTVFALSAFLSSCVGETEMPPYESPWQDPVGTGTVDNPFNCSAAVNKCVEIGTVASQVSYFVTGYVVEGSSGIETGFGNATFSMSDTEGGLAIFTAYHIRNFDNQKFVDGEEDAVKVGDKITIYAPLVNFKGNTPETNGGYLYALNGEVKGTPMIPDHGQFPAVAEGEGTEANPLNASQAVKVCEETGETTTSEYYYVSGYVVGGDGIDTGFGNGSFVLSDTYGGPGVFTAYRIYDIDGNKFTDSKKVKWGDFITIYGRLVNYKGNTPESAQGGKLIYVKPAEDF